MPTYDFQIVVQVTTAAEAWSNLVATQVGYIDLYDEDPTLFSAPYIETYLGHTCLMLDSTAESLDGRTYVWVVAEMTGDTILPTRYFLSQAGCQQYLMGATFGGISIGANYEICKGWILSFKEVLIVSLTDAVDYTEVWSEKEDSATGVKTGTHVITVEAPDEFYATVDGLRVGYDVVILERYTGVTPTSPPGYASQPVGGSDAGIIEAINAITDQDAEVSINQNAAAFSIKAKVVASKGGG